jgi:hypothetical protein
MIDRVECRACGAALTDPFLDLGPTPLETTKEMADIRAWRGRFVVPMPRVEIHESA